MIIKVVFAIAVAAIFSTTAIGADSKPSRVPVYISNGCTNHPIGQRLAFNIKEGLNRSTAMVAADSYKDSLITIGLVCLDDSDSSTIARYSYQINALNFNGFYDFSLAQGISSCGSRRVVECADLVVALIDETIFKFVAKVRAGEFKWLP